MKIPKASYQITSNNALKRTLNKPKTVSLSATVSHILETDATKRMQIANKVISMASSGNVNAIKLIWSYIDGTPISRVDMTSMGDKIQPPKIILNITEKQTQAIIAEGEIIDD